MAGSYVFQSPIGIIKICEENEKITNLYILQQQERELDLQQSQGEVALLKDYGKPSGLFYEAYRQIKEYFEGERKVFDLPVSYKGTLFQQRVWEELQKIPYGETWSYEDIAIGIGNKKAVRAVGQANNKNPIPLIIPCHRVINKNGSLGGFGCGIEVKKYLLNLEKNPM